LLKKKLLLGAIGLILLLAGLGADGVFHPRLEKIYLKTKLANAQKNLWQKEQLATELIQNVSVESQAKLNSQYDSLFALTKKEQISFYIYSGAKLVFWTTNSVFPKFSIPSDENLFLQKLDNGLYLQKNLLHNNLIYVVLIPVQYEYQYQNQYLQSHFALFPDNKVSFKISRNNVKTAIPFFDRHGRFLFGIFPETPWLPLVWIGWLFIVGTLFLLVFAHSLISSFLRQKRFLPAIFFYLLTVAIIILFWQNKIPRVLFASEIFSPDIYASSILLASLGDLFILTFLIFWTIVLILSVNFKVKKPPVFKYILCAFFFIISFVGCAYLEKMVGSLVFDSNISFRAGNVLSLGLFSYVGFFIIFSGLTCYFLWLHKIRPYLRHIFPSGWQFILFILLALLLAIVLGIYWLPQWYALVFMVFTFSAFYFINPGPKWKIRKWLVFYAVSALYLTVLVSIFNARKERDTQRLLVSQLANKGDAVAEYLFGNIYESISADNYIKSYFYNPLIVQNYLVRRIEQLYFSGYFSKYDVDVITFSDEGLPYLSGNSAKTLSYYQDFVKKEATPARENYLYFLNSYTGLPAYIAIIPIEREDELLGTIVLRIKQKPFYEESAYPELLLSDNLQHFKELEGYSYAIYNDRRLVTQHGDYSYPGIFTTNIDASNYYSTYKEEGYIHIANQVNAHLIAVLSSKENGLLYYIATFFFMLFFFSILGTVGLLVYRSFILFGISYSLAEFIRKFRRALSWKEMNFQTKVLFAILSSMTLALILIGFITVQYISYQFNKDELDTLKKNTRAIAAKLESKLQNEVQLLPTYDEDLNAAVKDLSGTYQSDINIYDVGGDPIATSQDLIYVRLLVGRKMDPRAYREFYTNHSSQFIQEEKIGSLSYTSSYIPIRNANGQVTAFLNLPYFSKEKQLEDKISSFLLALINLYVLLFLILISIGIFISNTLTAPLNIIRRHLSATGFGKSNELIEWKSNDEIGKLVQEYNSMIYALEESALRLAQSEREGAWREMAKQVAHEIKNPLTPMKLNIQQLQKAWKEDDTERLPELFQKVTQLLIRQIDSLSLIATEFGAFAKMPTGKPEAVDVNEILKEIKDLFGQQTEATIQLTPSPLKFLVWADRNQLSRALSNLIKNAIQAIPTERHGLIEIKTYIENNLAKIEIKDNGTGISDELADKIFIPNFSTKSSGMGLGLAIVKNIIEKAGGTISFKTQIGEGTTFSINLPLWGELGTESPPTPS